MRKSTIPLILLILLFVLVSLVVALSGRPGVSQPIAFNHRLHTEGNGIECIECHTYFMEHAVSGLPNPEVCSGCHEEPLTDSPEEKKLVSMLESGEGPVFQKLFHLADHVYYSHRRHVAIAELECQRCHGEIALTESPPRQPLVRVDMKFCVGCHDQLGVTNDCIACHR